MTNPAHAEDSEVVQENRDSENYKNDRFGRDVVPAGAVLILKWDRCRRARMKPRLRSHSYRCADTMFA